jgi:hypothetical protein
LFGDGHNAKEVGFELPRSAREAAADVGLERGEIEGMARKGKSPAHTDPGVHRKTWKFYASELDAWLCITICSTSDMTSLNGKETIQ